MASKKKSFVDKILERMDRIDSGSLQAQFARLAQQKGLLETIVQSMQEGLLVLDAGGSLTFANSAAESLLGFELQMSAGQPLERVLRGIDLPSLLESTVPAGSRLRTREIEVAYPRRRVLESYVVPLAEDTPGGGGTVLILRDVTRDREQSAATLESERLNAIMLLAAGVAHEINNPLAYMMLSLERLARRTLGTEDETLASSALDGARRIRAIVQDLKTFARPDSDRREPVRLVDVVRTVLTMTAHETRYRARVDCDVESSIFVRGDAGRLAQVFLNLVLNAAHAIGDGGPDAHRIGISATTTDGEVTVAVTDTGGGIAQADIARIFDPFFTTKEASVGSGLGLSISRSIIEAHGGRIEATSEVGRGTTVRVTLPAASEARGPSSEEAIARPEASRRLRVLVIDDEPVLCLLVEQLLAPKHDVTVFGNGRDARAHLGGDVTYDVILCDVMMPDVSGVDLYAFLAEGRPELARVLAFVTGGAFKPRTRALVERTGRPVLDKPFRREELLALVERIASA